MGRRDAATAAFLEAAGLPGNDAEAELLRRRAARLVPLTDPSIE
jgi:predicted RNA polymerase sigma factor